jgi:hypothetical protein
MSGPARTPPELVERYVASANWRTELARRAGLRTAPSRPECDEREELVGDLAVERQVADRR